MLLHAKLLTSTPVIGAVGSVHVLARSARQPQSTPQDSQMRVERVIRTHDAHVAESQISQPEKE